MTQFYRDMIGHSCEARTAFDHRATIGICQRYPSSRTMKYMDRIALLTQVLEQNPADAFARYGLAMAHVAEGRTDQALAEFSTLVQHNPDYVPAYQMSAQTLAKLNRGEEAVARLKEGIAAARRTGNGHAASEMQALLDDLAR